MTVVLVQARRIAVAGDAALRRPMADGGHGPGAQVPRVREAHRGGGRELPAHRHQELPLLRESRVLQPRTRSGTAYLLSVGPVCLARGAKYPQIVNCVGAGGDIGNGL